MTNGGKQTELEDLHAWSRCVLDYFKTLTSKPLLPMVELSANAVRAEQQTIARVLHRGSIKTDGEYRVLLDRVEDIHADDSRQAEVERLNELLRAYNEKSGQ